MEKCQIDYDTTGSGEAGPSNAPRKTVVEVAGQ
jgi:hypothetical protein